MGSAEAGLFLTAGAHYGSGSSGGQGSAGWQGGIGASVGISETRIDDTSWTKEIEAGGFFAAELSRRDPDIDCEITNIKQLAPGEREWVDNPRFEGIWEAVTE
jgi:hypothetical protein